MNATTLSFNNTSSPSLLVRFARALHREINHMAWQNATIAPRVNPDGFNFAGLWKKIENLTADNETTVQENRENMLYEYARFTMLEWCPDNALEHGRAVLATRMPEGDPLLNISHDDIIEYATKHYDKIIGDIQAAQANRNNLEI